MDWSKLLSKDRIRKSGRKIDARNEFESDFGRIIFSPAVRRMHDKTQVFPLTTDDNIHSRLTHSLEVMSVGYSLGVRICDSKEVQKKFSKEECELLREIPIILKNVCLVHDIGNPPFGHFGETVIQNYFKELFEKQNKRKIFNLFCCKKFKKGKDKIINLNTAQKRDFLEFDGNAQGLRVLTKLQSLNDDKGLNLTFATLASYIKYPNYGHKEKSKLAKKKIGVFYSEKEYFEQIMNGCGLKKDENEFIRHPLCYLMEAADSICYLVMDIEDAYSKGVITLDEFYDYLKDVPRVKDKLKAIYEDKDQNEITKIVNFRIYLIQSLVDLAYDNFIKNIDEIAKGKYDKELIEDEEQNKKN
ncbi:hypothetical protein CAPN004_03160 [Capnocytophaga cynodegmi]|uniref:dGTP triphosphohydrolase n=1 Tax=Capnocytophaga cynodegmi TaxID=28189 RepID=UPI001ACC331C|nr:dNTP triphosphohydrolase [Capnocytophaga cynodegmi]GIM51286.1 hypothetical protein CAPN004_03160 [Capnocytophaga cynodegmi]